ncbi:hypothetical protein [Brevibacterium sp. W7.2]|uniref:COG4315 family predicted lipoprotein n=1 Tax=Brevibacterium sp. W7.2 TaxID=2823518 RepID=UPI001BAD97CE|nr:hypothetical protein [Brevibacterium sp. W7.2]
MSTKLTALLAASTLIIAGLSGCGSGDGGGGYGAPASDDAPASDGASTSGGGSDVGAGAGTLTTAETDLGEIIVDGEGMTVYQFAKDTQGATASACEGDCAAKWPAVPGGAQVKLDGVTGDLATITGVDGKPQLTLDGWPLYYFADDTAAGDTKGQGLMDAWWVLSPEAKPIR